MASWPQTTCLNDPGDILSLDFCINNASKNAEGELRRLKHATLKCTTTPCETLRTVHQLEVVTTPNPPCDSALAQNLDGIFVVRELSTAFDQNGLGRGFHAGKFEWNANGGVAVVVGTVQGITNAGTHRAPVFQSCQPCNAEGYMEGHFCGRVATTQISKLKNCFVQGTYRFQFDPSLEAQSTSIHGTLEGVVVCPCP